MPGSVWFSQAKPATGTFATAIAAEPVHTKPCPLAARAAPRFVFGVEVCSDIIVLTFEASFVSDRLAERARPHTTVLRLDRDGVKHFFRLKYKKVFPSVIFDDSNAKKCLKTHVVAMSSSRLRIASGASVSARHC